MKPNPRRGPLHPGPAWHKSSRSYTNGDCLEVRLIDGRLEVRDSKDPHGPILRYSGNQWLAFLQSVTGKTR